MAYTKQQKKGILSIKKPFKGQIELMTNNARKANKKNFPDGYLYVIKQKGFNIYKFGVSNNPKRRIKDIDSASPFGIEVITVNFFKNVYEIEECIHENIREYLMRKEWFKIDKKIVSSLVDQIKELSKEGYYLIRK